MFKFTLKRIILILSCAILGSLLGAGLWYSNKKFPKLWKDPLGADLTGATIIGFVAGIFIAILILYVFFNGERDEEV
jgi:hypothetical protein